MQIHTFRENLIARVLGVYLFVEVVLVPLAFYEIAPFELSLIRHSHLKISGWTIQALGHLPQDALYGIIVLLFFIFVVRKGQLRPLLERDAGKFRRLAILVCMVAALCVLMPFNIIATPAIIGLVTCIITGVSEEWVFRSVITRVFRLRTGLVVACVLASLLFALSHIAEVFVYQHETLSNGLVALSDDFVFGLFFSLIIWRGRSITWAGFMHALCDWSPWTYGGHRWITVFNVPWLGENFTISFLVGLVGAEVIRACTFVRRNPATHDLCLNVQ